LNRALFLLLGLFAHIYINYGYPEQIFGFMIKD